MTPLATIAGYLALTTIAGSLLARRTRTSRDWAVAGGSLGTAMIAAGVAGTRIGGAGTYGVAGNVLAGGVWYLWWYAIATFLALALVGLFFAVPYRRLGLATVGEAFTVRFGRRRSQVLTSLCVQTEYFVVNVIEVYLIGAILRSLTGWPMAATLLVAAAVLVSYTALGGLKGAAAANLIHCGMILLGLAAIAAIGLEQAGGWAGLFSQIDARLARAGAPAARWWSPVGAGWVPILAMIFSAVVHTPAASIYANFATSARSERLLRPAFLAAGGVAASMPLLAGLVGMLTLARYGPGRGLEGYSHITALATDLDPWVGGAALAAILAAVISSGGPVLLSSATMFVRDWLPPRPDGSARPLRNYRAATLVYGLLAAATAWLVSRTPASLLDLLLLGYAMVVPPAVALAYLIYWRRTTEAGAFWGTGAGYLGGLAAYLWHRRGGPDPSYATTLLPLLVVPLVSRLSPPQGGAAFHAILAGREARREPERP